MEICYLNIEENKKWEKYQRCILHHIPLRTYKPNFMSKKVKAYLQLKMISECELHKK